MDELDSFYAHAKDLAGACSRGDYLTCTSFAGFSLQCAFSARLAREGHSMSHPFGVEGFFYGGYPEAERKILIFLPSYLSQEDVVQAEEGDLQPLSCLRIAPKSEKFAAKMGHRDYLGALLGLGIERERIGDILVGENDAYVYIRKENEGFLVSSLKEVGRNKVSAVPADLLSCPYRPEMEERSFSVPSPRLDAILSGAFRLSREQAKQEIESGNVFCTSSPSRADAHPKPGEHISLRGKGKFLYLGEAGASKKGKSIVKIKIPK